MSPHVRPLLVALVGAILVPPGARAGDPAVAPAPRPTPAGPPC